MNITTRIIAPITNAMMMIMTKITIPAIAPRSIPPLSAPGEVPMIVKALHHQSTSKIISLGTHDDMIASVPQARSQLFNIAHYTL